MTTATVVGAGLAGCECAWQLAEHGIDVKLIEQRPVSTTPAHQTDLFGELICSNSLRANRPAKAVGCLKLELGFCGSIVLQMAEKHRVPAGVSLAVDRDAFALELTKVISSHDRIKVVREHCDAVPSDRPCVIATGPLTSDDLATDLSRLVGSDALHYYDAIAPVVAARSIEWDRVFRQSRYARSDVDAAPDQQEANARDHGDYINCPLDREQYESFVAALLEAAQIKPRSFEQIPYFEACLPIEVMAERGLKTLAFGPMKPVGLVDPGTGKRPYAVVQLRAENLAQTAFNMVGFQTRLTRPEQKRIFRMIPGLAEAEFLRWGSIHRNTFVDAPLALDETLQLKNEPGVYLAGQIAGVEGYTESIACGLMCGLMLAYSLHGHKLARPPVTSTLGGLLNHLTRVDVPFQPSNITWAHVPPIEGRMPKQVRDVSMAERAWNALVEWRLSSSDAEVLDGTIE